MAKLRIKSTAVPSYAKARKSRWTSGTIRRISSGKKKAKAAERYAYLEGLVARARAEKDVRKRQHRALEGMEEGLVQDRQRRKQATVEDSSDEENSDTTFAGFEEEFENPIRGPWAPHMSPKQRRNNKSKDHKRRKKDRAAEVLLHQHNARMDRKGLDELSSHQIQARINELQELKTTLRRRKNQSREREREDSSVSDSDSSINSESGSNLETTDDSAEDTDDGYDGKGVHTSKPPMYMGESRKELDNWAARCTYTFEAKPKTYKLDKAKIKYVMPFMDDDIGLSWKDEEASRRHAGKQRATWKKFVKFLGDLLGDAGTQQSSDEQAYADARQTWAVSPAQFAIQLRRLEMRLDRKSTKTQLSDLFTKLLPSIRNHILANNGYPKTRNSLLTTAEAVYRLQKKDGKSDLKEGRRTAPAGAPASPRADRLPPKGTQLSEAQLKKIREDKAKLDLSRRDGNLCYTCGSDGHYKKQCPKKSSRGPQHQLPLADEITAKDQDAGKDQA